MQGGFSAMTVAFCKNLCYTGENCLVEGIIMEAYIYDKLHEDFVSLRYLTSGFENDKKAMMEILEDLDRIIPYIEKFGTEDERAVLGYAVRTAVALGKEILPHLHIYNPRHALFCIDKRGKKLERLHLFCDAVHNLCELFTGDTWSKDQYHEIFIAPFRKKYGGVFFREVLYYFGED